ncbi:MAG: hypothetical protein HQ582_26830 [Planctomycetes bacterium]|nr:hypothetical protein [Planctomycetota bacterium]
MRILNAADGEEVLTLRAEGKVRDICFNTDGTQILCAFGDNPTIRLWDVATGMTIPWSSNRVSYTRTVSVSPDGKWFALAGGGVSLHDVETGGQLVTLEEPTHLRVSDVAFSPDGTWLAAVGGSEIKIRDTATGQILHRLKGHEAGVRSVAFSLDGTRIASGSSDSTIRVWDTDTGREIIELENQGEFVTTVAFDNTGQRIISAHVGGTLRIWDGTLIDDLESADEAAQEAVITGDVQLPRTPSWNTKF